MNMTPGWPSPHTHTMCSSDSKSGNWYDNELQTAQTFSYFACEARITERRSRENRANYRDKGQFKSRQFIFKGQLLSNH